MPSGRGSRWLRTAVGAAAVVLPFAGAGSAQAALAGAQHASMSNVPVLTSATISSSDPYEVTVCYDKPISPGAGGSSSAQKVVVEGYRAYNVLYASSIGAPSGDCFNAFFPNAGNYSGGSSGAGGGLTQYTVLSVAPGVVDSSATGSANLADSVALGGSTTNAGTRGNTVAPDLAGIEAPTAAAPNTFTFVFNKPVVGSSNDAPGPVANDFYVVSSSGTIYRAASATVDSSAPTQVEATFQGVGSNVALGGTFAGAVVASGDAFVDGVGAANPDESSLVSGGSPETDPYLQAATLGGDQNSITYTLSGEPGATQVANDYEAELANGAVMCASTVLTPEPSANGAYTVTAEFGTSPTLADQVEFAVYAFVNSGNTSSGNAPGCSNNSAGNVFAAKRLGARTAAQTAGATSFPYADGNDVVPSGAPVGGNDGAFAEGFTTAPDVFGILVQSDITLPGVTGSYDVLGVNLDDRVVEIDANLIALYDSAGDQVDSSATPESLLVNCGGVMEPTAAPDSFSGGYAQAPPCSTPGDEEVYLLYPVGELANVTSVEFEGTPLGEVGNGTDYGQLQGVFEGTLADNNNALGGSTSMDAYSISQLVGTVPSSAIVRTYRENVAKIRRARRLARAHRSKRHEHAARHGRTRNSRKRFERR